MYSNIKNFQWFRLTAKARTAVLLFAAGLASMVTVRPAGAQLSGRCPVVSERSLDSQAYPLLPPDRDYIPDDAVHPPFVSSARRLLSEPELPSAPLDWIQHSLDWTNFILAKFPPQLSEPPERREALLRLDDVLHLEDAPKFDAVERFYRSRIEDAIAEIEKTKVTKSVRIWKLYNHGFFIRTPSVSFTFDIVSGTEQPGFSLSSDQLRRLVAQSDITFISHWHPDHADKRVARLFLDAGKSVFAPPGLWSDDSDFSTRLTYPERDGRQRSIPYVSAGRTGHLEVVTYAGHQGLDVLNNVYLITTNENFTVIHTGDQYAPTPDFSDYKWLDKISTQHQVDVLLVNSWTPSLKRIAEGARPKLLITGHEDEMSHGIAHREGYDQTYDRLFCVPFPYLVMTWGESFSYHANDF